MLASDQTFDAVRGGARLILNYDAANNAFTGTVENTTGNVLTNVRIEVHLSNGTGAGARPPRWTWLPVEVLDGQPAVNPRHPSPAGSPTPR